MSEINLFRQFRALLPNERRLYVEVVQVRANGRTIVRTPEGRQFSVSGSGVPVGSNGFVVGDRLDGSAPRLPISLFDV